MSSPVKCMYRYLGVQLVQEVHELPTCNFHFVFQKKFSMPTEVSFQRWRKLPFEFLNIFLELFLVRSRHFVCYAYNHPVLSYFEYCFLSAEKKLTTHLTSVMRSQRKTDKSVPIWKLYLDICMYSTHTMLQKQSSGCTKVLIFKREKIWQLEYALFLLVLWRLGLKQEDMETHVCPGTWGAVASNSFWT